MELKKYQERVVAEARTFLAGLAEKQAQGSDFPSLAAWRACGIPRPYHARETGAKRDLPTFCVKVPTGGGKSLLATQILGLIYKTILSERNGAGLCIWVVPSDQIYKDTLRRLRDKRDFHRESLEFALGRRVDVWEKHEIARMTPGQLAGALNILVVKLQGANRQDRESLKFFRDSGGNIVAHFPAEDDANGNRNLLERVPNLDMIEADPARGAYLAKTSLANLVRLCAPPVILDEGHKATSTLARETIEGMNPRVIVELSATPHDRANVLSSVSGKELLDEEMIKLPLNVANSNQSSWKDVLTAARDRREALWKTAKSAHKAGERFIRPIVLVQVERTGKDQREEEYVHSEAVKEHLIQRLGIEERAIAIKTSEKDDIEGIDLLDESCQIDWIVTKQALQEGWDCPFAYILVSLSNTKSQRTMTQLVGRVLRQPFAKKTKFPDLNESYIYCLRLGAAEVVRQVKKALEDEGYEGDGVSVIDRSDARGKPDEPRFARIQPKYAQPYRRDFEGRIFLPRFCVKRGMEYEPLDYFRHLLAEVDTTCFDYDNIASWDFAKELAAAQEEFYRIGLGDDRETKRRRAEASESDADVRAWLVGNLGIDWMSARELRRIVGEACARLDIVAGKLALVKFAVRERIAGFVERETNSATQSVFRRLHDEGNLLFYLECASGRFEIPAQVRLRTVRRLRREDDSDLQRTLFDIVEADINEYEKSVALFLDHHPEVLWWYRNLVGPANFSIQGYKRGKIYPDFVVQEGDAANNRPTASVLVIESKGKHLAGNDDTQYKREVADTFTEVGRRVPWQNLGEGFEHHRFRFQILDQGAYADRDWRRDLGAILASQ